jgi:MFS transporter, NNP family, nitrate/nitrite transporter
MIFFEGPDIERLEVRADDGFATFGGLSAIAFALVVLHRIRWLEWALPMESPVIADAMQPAGVRVDIGA